MTVWAVAACHRADLEKIQSSTTKLGLPANRVIVVSNGEEPILSGEVPSARVIQYPDNGNFNLSAWWNYGIDYVRTHATDEYEIFVFNADCYTTPNTVEKLRSVMRLHDLSVVGPDQCQVAQGPVHVETNLHPVYDKRYRLTGYAFMIAGESGIRCDENIRFWYNDDDIEWQGRSLKGTGLVQGLRVDHPAAGNLSCSMGPLLQQYAREDREYFRNKWGAYPH
jgi:GT2 family glycosyltransferase